GGGRARGGVGGGPASAADEISWAPAGRRIDASSLEGVGAVVNLAGSGIGDKRWSEAYKNQVLQSRVEATTLLARTLADLGTRPLVLLSGSAIGIYGDRGDEVLDETSTPGSDFLADVARPWEASAQPAGEAGIRPALPPTG